MRAIRPCLLGVPFILSACLIAGSEPYIFTVKSAKGLAAHTGGEEVMLQCPSGARVLSVTLSMRCTGGTIKLSLVDPAGVVCCKETLRGGERECTLQWPARTGAWYCRLDLSEFQGDYSVHMSTKRP